MAHPRKIPGNIRVTRKVNQMGFQPALLLDVNPRRNGWKPGSPGAKLWSAICDYMHVKDGNKSLSGVSLLVQELQPGQLDGILKDKACSK